MLPDSQKRKKNFIKKKRGKDLLNLVNLPRSQHVHPALPL